MCSHSGCTLQHPSLNRSPSVLPIPEYNVLSRVYDRWQNTYGSDYSTLILPRLLATIAKYRIPKTSMLDLACGTGSLAFMMARKGWDVCGVDASEGMLAAAIEKNRRVRPPLRFFRQDMRELRLPAQVGLVTSMFDSLNHLPSVRDLLRTFRAVHACLEPGGHFVFDLNNERCFRTLWTRNEAVHHRDFTLILQNSYSQERKAACSQVTLFLRSGQTFERHRELVYERFFPRRDVAQMLRRAGFIVQESTEFNFTKNPLIGSIKTWWVARKGTSD